MPAPRAEAIIGCLLGAAVGDGLGLWCEGMSPGRQRRFHRDIGYHFIFGRGMTSDDTEHACMTGQALIVSAGEVRAFLRSLAWRLRFWLLGMPAGIGRATLRGIVKLWLGWPARSSGVYSAGNGPAMRSPLLGVCHGADSRRLHELVLACTRITHRDPKAAFGALAAAVAAHVASTRAETAGLAEEYLRRLRQALGDEGAELLALGERAAASAAAGEPTEAFAASLNLQRGVSGYIYHTMPVVLQAWLRWPEDFRSALAAVIPCGGDTDTTAAILGSIVAARVGRAGIPTEWLAGLWEWPRSVRWIERLGTRLAEVCATGAPQRAVPLFVPGLFLRNLFFLVAVLMHVLRRLLPPY